MKYTDREIDNFHREIKEALSRIEEQTKATNGAVARIQKWKERVTGASGVILIVVLPLLSWGLYQIANIDDKVEEGIFKELSKYSIEIR